MSNTENVKKKKVKAKPKTVKVATKPKVKPVKPLPKSPGKVAKCINDLIPEAVKIADNAMPLMSELSAEMRSMAWNRTYHSAMNRMAKEHGFR